MAQAQAEGRGPLGGLSAILSSPTQGENPVVLGPNWFASVMGTGIIAVAGATLPIRFPGLDALTMVAWLIAAVILVVLSILVPIHWLRRRGTVYQVAHDPIMAQFFGAPPMAFMTVGAGTLLVGKRLIGEQAAVAVDWVLWTIGTLGGLATAAIVPFLLFTRHEVRQDGAFGGWLMPIVPPMVSAATGALLIPHVPAGQPRETMLVLCYAMFGMSLVTAMIVITLIWSRLAHFGSSGSARVPTLWIVLGPVGQSITAAGTLGTAAAGAVAAPLAAALNVVAILYGVPMWGFMLLWMALATMLTVRTIRRKLPFALTWWSFTFPVGTCVTGTTQLAVHTGLDMFRWGALVLYLVLLTAWVVVAVRTGQGALRGDLLHVKLGAPAPEAKKNQALPDTTEPA